MLLKLDAFLKAFLLPGLLLLFLLLPDTTAAAVWKTSHTCTHSFSTTHVRSSTACKSAFKTLVPTATVNAAVTTITDSTKPFGCFKSHRGLTFNTHFASKTTCSGILQCICETVEDCTDNNGLTSNTPSQSACNCGPNTQCLEPPLVTATPSTGFICFVAQGTPNSGSCRNKNLGNWGYQMETQTNRCQNNAATITTKQDCVLAATRMQVLQGFGVDVGGYESMVTTVSSSHDPPGCSQTTPGFGGTPQIHWNTKNSAKPCSNIDCLCLSSLFYCSNNDGTAPSEIGCKCARSYPDVNVRNTFDHTICTAATGTFCTSSTSGSTTTNACAKPPTCVHTKGNTPNQQMCTCGFLNGNEDTVCAKETGLYCSTFTTPHRSFLVSGTCNAAPGAPPYFSLNSGQCSDIEHGQLILPPTNARFFNQATSSSGLSKCHNASVFLRLGDDKPPTEIRGSSLPGCTFTHSLSFNQELHESYQQTQPWYTDYKCSPESKCLCRTVLPCANIDGATTNTGPCQCGQVTCHDAESTGLICYICDPSRQYEQCSPDSSVVSFDEGSCRKEGWGKYGYFTKTSGFCNSPVNSKEMCERTVKRMGFNAVSVAALVTEESERSNVPEGCYVSFEEAEGSLHFNPERTPEPRTLCSDKHTCVCVIGNIEEAQRVEGAEGSNDWLSLVIVVLIPGVVLFLGCACWVGTRRSGRRRRQAAQENTGGGNRGGGIQMTTQRETTQPSLQGRVLRVNAPRQEYTYPQATVQPMQPMQPIVQPIYPVQPMQQPMQQVPLPYYNNPSVAVTATVVRAVPIEVDSVAY
jgi:hypothetical protein